MRRNTMKVSVLLGLILVVTGMIHIVVGTLVTAIMTADPDLSYLEILGIPFVMVGTILLTVGIFIILIGRKFKLGWRI